MIIFNIKNIRKEKDISIYKLEQLTHLSRAYISRLENNIKLNPSLNTLLRIAEALKVNIKDLFYTKLDIEELKSELNKKIKKYGLNSSEVMEISQLIDLLINIDIKEKELNE